jgi:hypothetical protein
MGLPQVVFASRPFLDSFCQQTDDLGVSGLSILVIDAEVCHPAPARRQVRSVLDDMVRFLTAGRTGGPPEVLWASDPGSEPE